MSTHVPSVGTPCGRSAAIEAEGWTRRFTAIGSRLSETVALYRALGYELRLEPADVGEAGGAGLHDESCAHCMVMTLARTIYTRRPVSTGGDGEWKE
jgi:hypothetical protein